MRRGFTLVEVLVVLAILGIMAAATAPALDRFLDAGGPATPAQELAQVLRQARGVAVEEARPVAVVLDPATGRYRVEADTLAAGVIPGAGVMAVNTARRRRNGTSRLRIAFRPDGTAAGGPAYLDTADGRVVVRVDPWTGRVDVAAP